MHAELPRAEFAFPGPLRDQLVAAILDGSKTSTTGLVIDYEVSGDPLPVIGSLAIVVDSEDRAVAVIETTAWQISRLADVDLQHALDEGEGYTTVAQWRAGHEKFWHSDDMREALKLPDFAVDDDTMVVMERFQVIEHL